MRYLRKIPSEVYVFGFWALVIGTIGAVLWGPDLFEYQRLQKLEKKIAHHSRQLVANIELDVTQLELPEPSLPISSCAYAIVLIDPTNLLPSKLYPKRNDRIYFGGSGYKQIDSKRFDPSSLEYLVVAHAFVGERQDYRPEWLVGRSLTGRAIHYNAYFYNVREGRYESKQTFGTTLPREREVPYVDRNNPKDFSVLATSDMKRAIHDRTLCGD